MKHSAPNRLFAPDPPAEALSLPAGVVFQKLDQLRTELSDLAFVLDTGGRIEAADLANMIGARLTELRSELSPPAPAQLLR